MPLQVNSQNKSRNFIYLLAALIGLFLLIPLIGITGFGDYPRALSFITAAIFSLMLLSAVFAVARRRSILIIGISLAAPAVLARLSSQFTELDSLRIISDLLDMAFVAFVIYHLIHFLFHTRHVSVNMIVASLCAYLLLSIWFASAYSLINTIDPTSFRVLTESSNSFGDKADGLALYYSIVTLTTLGYGDIVPMNNFARMLAAIEAIVGQIYLVVLVARLVGMHIAENQSTNITHDSE